MLSYWSFELMWRLDLLLGRVGSLSFFFLEIFLCAIFSIYYFILFLEYTTLNYLSFQLSTPIPLLLFFILFKVRRRTVIKLFDKQYKSANKIKMKGKKHKKSEDSD